LSGWLAAGPWQSARAAQALRVLAWPGYADADIVQGFERATGVRVDVTIIDSDEVMWQRVSQNNAQDFDVFAVNTAELQRYIRRGLVVGIDTAALPNRARQLPRFRNLAAIPGLVHRDKTFGVPYAYGEMGLIYDRQQVKPAPESIQELWNPRWHGKVVGYDGGTHSFSLAALALGLKSPFNLTQAQWPLAVDRLIALRRNAAGFYTQPEESVALFRNRQAALLFANYGSQQLKLLQAAGADVGYVIPREGALAWLDCWAITRGARDVGLAQHWIDHMLGAEAGQVLVTRQGLNNTIAEPVAGRPGDPLVWLEPVESEERRNRLWSRILSGDRAAKVLAS
jgi:putative spermidine/putrescine transport system substrate-binding protein